jgi:histidine triad (HIT) family protein
MNGFRNHLVRLVWLFASLWIFTASAWSSEQRACVFCDIAGGKLSAENVIYRDDLVVAFMDRAPRNPGHVLVVPIIHADGLLDVPPATLARLPQVAQRVATAITKTDLRAEGFTLTSNTGTAAGQSVRHLHLHVIPRFKGEPPNRGEDNIAPPAEVTAVAAKLRVVLGTETPEQKR